MRRTLKLIGIIAGAVLVLFIVALVAVGMLFNPNDYKDEIVAAAEKATGRKLTLDGDLELAVFPSIRIESLFPSILRRRMGSGHSRCFFA